MFLKLAAKSVWNRRGSALLTVAAIAVGIFVLLGVEHLRAQARHSFASTVSGVDLVVGARTGSVNLLLYSVFRVGSPTNNIAWESYEEIASGADVDWAIPIALGDSHKGYRVMGTTGDYFEHFSYGDRHRLGFARGGPFSEVFDVVLGAEVAARLGYGLGDKLVLAHGVAATSFSLHDHAPFVVVGILDATGTPVDQTLHVGLRGIEAIHSGPRHGAGPANPELVAAHPETITAFMLGLKSRMSTFRVQRAINGYAKEPLLAILPGVALAELWRTMAILEDTLRLVAALVLLASVLGLSAMLLASIREREREIQLLRVVGASPVFVFLLIEAEALLISLFGVLLGALGLYTCLAWFGERLVGQFGLRIPTDILSGAHWPLLSLVALATLIAAVIPSCSAYRSASLARVA